MSLSRSIDVPSAVTALALVEDGDLLVGSGTSHDHILNIVLKRT